MFGDSLVASILWVKGIQESLHAAHHIHNDTRNKTMGGYSVVYRQYFLKIWYKVVYIDNNFHKLDYKKRSDLYGSQQAFKEMFKKLK